MGQGEPHEERRQSQDPRLSGELRVSRGVEIEEDEHAREDRRIGDIEGKLPDPQEKVEEEDRHHPPAVGHVVISQRLEHIAKRRDMLRRSPDHGIVVVVPMERHEPVQREHEEKDRRQNEDDPARMVSHVPASFRLPPYFKQQNARLIKRQCKTYANERSSARLVFLMRTRLSPHALFLNRYKRSGCASLSFFMRNFPFHSKNSHYGISSSCRADLVPIMRVFSWQKTS